MIAMSEGIYSSFVSAELIQNCNDQIKERVSQVGTICAFVIPFTG